MPPNVPQETKIKQIMEDKNKQQVINHPKPHIQECSTNAVTNDQVHPVTSTNANVLPPLPGFVVKHPLKTPAAYRRRSYGLIEPKTPFGYMRAIPETEDNSTVEKEQRVKEIRQRNEHWRTKRNSMPSLKAYKNL